VHTPPAAQETVPCAAVGEGEETLSVSPSTSVSPTSTLVEPAVSSSVEIVSSSATGALFSGSTVMLTVAVSVPPCPSEIVYWNESGPL
jgi:hypothetical protein